MRYSIIILVILIGLSGCCENEKFDYSVNPSQYSCTEEQLKLVREEVDICLETSYFSSYCFAQAKATICNEIKKEHEYK